MAEYSDVPESFPFPFPPYDIQKDFMSQLYQTLDQSKIGIFESPTGTGKSLSLICGALKWLNDFEEKQRQELEDLLQGKTKTTSDTRTSKQDDDEPDWLAEFDEKKAQMDQAAELKDKIDKRLKYEEKLKQLKDTRKKYQSKRKHSVSEKDISGENKDEDITADDETKDEDEEMDNDIVVADYLSDDETKFSDDDDEKDDEEEDVPHVTKIFFCSRTHSQLAQFVREVQKSPFGEDTKVVTLGSRQNLCINESVRRFRSLSLINEKCLELQKNKKERKRNDDEETQRKRRKKAVGCPFNNYTALMDYKDRVLVEVQDIEQLVSLGKEMKTCPYYGTRYTIPMAQLVVLPYNTLLHKSTREACGIKLEGNIVIIDEAHNLLDTISNIHSIMITGMQLTRAHSQLSQYMEKYKSRLKAKNLMYIKQILFLLNCLVKGLNGRLGVPPHLQNTGPSSVKLLTINDFLFTTQMDNINLFKVRKYCEKSQISKKLNGFLERYQPGVEIKQQKSSCNKSGMTQFLQDMSKKNTVEQKNNNSSGGAGVADESQVISSSPLRQIEEFLHALTNADKDGRVVINKQETLSESSVKFLLLNPAVHFKEIVTKCKSVIVAGGTMQPISEFKEQLFFATGVTPEKISEFACGHVIPDDHLLPIALCTGPVGVELDFTYQSRDKKEMLDELGRVMCNVCSVVPGGVVCFFPSYEYEYKVHAHWDKTGVLTRLGAKKKVLREPRKANLSENVLAEYTSCIQQCDKTSNESGITGALLLSVVGGKMSEGINFSDGLGRCIVMVGLPYPNIKSPELKEKMDYLNSTMGPSGDGKLPGQIHYENLCMKAVNQSIGRAIRHKDDYATILLLDHRYAKSHIRTKLPGWIASELQVMQKFGPAQAAIKKFFVSKESE